MELSVRWHGEAQVTAGGEGWGWDSVVQLSTSMSKALGSIPSTAKKNNK